MKIAIGMGIGYGPAPGGAAPLAAVLNVSGLFKASDFIGDDDTDLTTYDAEWEQHSGVTPATGGWEIKSNKCSKVSTSDDFYASVSKSASATVNSRMQVVISADQATNIFGHCLRYKVDDGGSFSFYLANADGNGNSFSLWKVTNGGWSKEAETFEAIAPETAPIEMVVSIEHNGGDNVLTSNADGDQKLQWTDLAASTPFRAGYNRAGLRAAIGGNHENYDDFFWTGSRVIIRGLGAGWDIVVTDRDGTQFASNASSGVANMNANSLYAPFQKYEIRDAGDVVRLTVLAGDLGVDHLVGGDDLTITGV